MLPALLILLRLVVDFHVFMLVTEWESSGIRSNKGKAYDMVNILNKVVHFHVSSLTTFAHAIGTVVKRKRGKLLADLAEPGNEILMARGRQGW